MLVFDIETVPTVAAMATPYPEADRSPPGNYRSDEAVAKWRDKDRESWDDGRVKQYSLNPRTGRVVAIGANVGNSEVAIAKTEANEAGLLRDWWRWVRDHRNIGGFNSMGFDLPFLLTRSLILGVSPDIDVTKYLRRYNYQPHFDARMALAMWDSRASGTLDDWCGAFGIKGKGGHGSEVYGMTQRGEWDDLSDYCLGDVTATATLIERIAPTFGVTP